MAIVSFYWRERRQSDLEKSARIPIRKNLLEVSHVSVDVSVIPLFSRHIHLGKIYLDGVNLQVETQADGRTNLDVLTHKTAQSSVAQTSGTVVPEPSVPATPRSSSSSSSSPSSIAQASSSDGASA
ncbi:AsmA family protein [Vibrio sp. PP-XX7]